MFQIRALRATFHFLGLIYFDGFPDKYIDTISIDFSIMYFKGSAVELSKL